jgi:hypothetical protein
LGHAVEPADSLGRQRLDNELLKSLSDLMLAARCSRHRIAADSLFFDQAIMLPPDSPLLTPSHHKGNDNASTH